MPTASRYLVQYGRSAFVGRFDALNRVAASRGVRVVVHTPRGLEIGTVLCEATESFSASLDPTAGGKLLRVAGPDDEVDAHECEQFGQRILTAAEQFAVEKGLPLLFVDVEVMLDRASVVLHTVPWESCHADALFAVLTTQFEVPVQMLDLSRTPTIPDPPEKTSSCSKPGCGTSSGGCTSCGTGGGCSTGSCSKGSVKSAEELTDYFANLRRQMEAQAFHRTPLN